MAPPHCNCSQEVNMHDVILAASTVKDKVSKGNAKGINYSFGFKVFTNYTLGVCTLLTMISFADYLLSHIDCYHFSDDTVPKESFQAYCTAHGGSRTPKYENEQTEENHGQVRSIFKKGL